MSMIRLPNNKTIYIDFDNEMDIEDVVRKFCGDDFALNLMKYIDGVKADAESDMGVYEWKNENFRTTLCNINNILEEYKRNVDNGTEKFLRKRVFELFKKIHYLIGKVI